MRGNEKVWKLKDHHIVPLTNLGLINTPKYDKHPQGNRPTKNIH